MKKEAIEQISYCLQAGLGEWADVPFGEWIEDYFGKDTIKEISGEGVDWSYNITNYILEHRKQIFLEKYNETKCFLIYPNKYPICRDCDPEKKKICKKYCDHLSFLNKMSILAVLQDYEVDEFINDFIVPILKKN